MTGSGNRRDRGGCGCPKNLERRIRLCPRAVLLVSITLLWLGARVPHAPTSRRHASSTRSLCTGWGLSSRAGSLLRSTGSAAHRQSCLSSMATARPPVAANRLHTAARGPDLEAVPGAGRRRTLTDLEASTDPRGAGGHDRQRSGALQSPRTGQGLPRRALQAARPPRRLACASISECRATRD